MIELSLNPVGASAVQCIYGQHREWATLGFIRAIASNVTICRCLVDKRWLHTLLAMINDPAAATSSDDDDNHVHHCSLPKRVIAASRLENLILIFMFQSIFIVVFNLRVL